MYLFVTRVVWFDKFWDQSSLFRMWTEIATKNHEMRRVYLYLLIFAMGVLNSLVITYFVVKFSPSNRLRRNYLSDEHFLQVRDESVYSLVSGRSKNGKAPQKKIDKDRSSIEGG